MEDYDDEELRLDKEYSENLIKEINDQHKRDNFDKTCVFVFSDIQSYLEREGLDIFYGLSVDKIIELLNILT
jgi:hypothetical protein